MKWNRTRKYAAAAGVLLLLWGCSDPSSPATSDSETGTHPASQSDAEPTDTATGEDAVPTEAPTDGNATDASDDTTGPDAPTDAADTGTDDPTESDTPSDTGDSADTQSDTGGASDSETATAPPPVDPVDPLPGALHSFDTGYTVLLVRAAAYKGKSVIVAASYEGTVMALTYDGTVLWTAPLTGHMVRDLYCGDLDGDGNDEVLAAVSDGSVHALDVVTGRPVWNAPFHPNEVPMNGVCTVRTHDGTYVAAGGFDKNLYYLDAAGTLVKTVPSADYSDLQPWGEDRWHLGREVGFAHTVNFLRPVPQPDGTDHLLLLGMHNHMQVSGKLYEFAPLASEPTASYDIPFNRPIGHMAVMDPAGDGHYQVLMGSSELSNQRAIALDLASGAARTHDLTQVGPNGYRVTQVIAIPQKDSYRYLLLCGTHLVVLPPDFDAANKQTVAGRLAYFDLWYDQAAGRILLASAQSGGSAVHVLDPEDAQWQQAFSQLDPPGKIQTIKANQERLRQALTRFVRPAHERTPDPVVFTAADPHHPTAQALIDRGAPGAVFLSTDRSVQWNNVQSRDWRTAMTNATYRDKEDKRMQYVLSQDEAVTSFQPGYQDTAARGIAYWAGHGNDPYYYQPETHMRILDTAPSGATTVMIWPEVGGHEASFSYVLDNLFYPLAAYARPRGGKIVFRSKNIFFQSTPYQPHWSRFLSGEFKDVFVSSMEETTDKTQDMSLAGRIGLWAADVMENWGMRCSRDNPSFDRSRQHAYQQIANHFLRTTVYSLAYGARYVQNTYTDPDTLSLVWQLVADGALFVPRRNEIVSFSPVHLGMTDPDERYIVEGSNNKWTVFWDAEDEAANPMVFSRMNGTWMAAPPTPWDYSTWASGVHERRQHFIPPFENGMVLITPVQEGVHAAPSSYRTPLAENLHPLYRDRLVEYVTNGRDYLDATSDATYPADGPMYAEIAAAVRDKARELPLTVSGGVGWVCAQTSPTHLRLTLVDSGYLNPSDKVAHVHFHTATPVALTDVVFGDTYEPGKDVAIPVPLGLFRFIDIELAAPLQ